MSNDTSMKLYSAEASPYSRKVRILAIELGLMDRIEVVQQSPRDNSSGFFAVNPLARVPALDTGSSILYDSPVICEYLNALVHGELIPKDEPMRWSVLRRQALADGILDTALPLRGELLRPIERQSEELVNRHRATIDRALDAAEADCAGVDERQFDLGLISVGSALGWLDFRFPDWGWRPPRPRLAHLMDELSARPSFRSTAPK